MCYMRKPRILVEDAWYHVTARANRGEMLFEEEAARDLFILFIDRAKKRYRFSIANFCVMGNHIHLLIQAGRGESLSAIMRWILGNFARAYNKKQGWTGHFWGERFHSRVLHGMRHIAIACNYIDQNPVKAGLVSHCRLWRHGGAGARFGSLAEKIIDAPPWMALLASLRESLSVLEWQPPHG